MSHVVMVSDVVPVSSAPMVAGAHVVDRCGRVVTRADVTMTVHSMIIDLMRDCRAQERATDDKSERSVVVRTGGACRDGKRQYGSGDQIRS